jgi:hypothetical protein
MATHRPTEKWNQRLSRAISIAIILCAAVSAVLALRRYEVDPRTDDAEVFANFIGIAPLVSGPITKLNVVDNQLVKQGFLRSTAVPMPMRWRGQNPMRRRWAERLAMSGALLPEK